MRLSERRDKRPGKLRCETSDAFNRIWIHESFCNSCVKSHSHKYQFYYSDFSQLQHIGWEGASHWRPLYKRIPKINLQTPGEPLKQQQTTAGWQGGDPVRVREGTGGGASASVSWRSCVWGSPCVRKLDFTGRPRLSPSVALSIFILLLCLSVDLFVRCGRCSF